MVSLYKDKEIVWFYRIIIGLLIFVLLLMITGGEGLFTLAILLAIGSFLYLGWPISAKVNGDRTVLFRTPLRTVTVSPQKLVTVKVVGARDYRAHISIRTKMNLPIGYRCRQYERAPELANAVLAVIDKAPQAKVNIDAMKLLKQVAKGKLKPLPLK